ncbi:xanthine dehydrogenase family protein molybdopterin-binding subunit [Pseudomonas tohonis]|uniref:xanthine dehydrogenase family protein molybdopterin-binding subunit n=1 Tax=Pseudomonas tohonis TaxID=2725477 RepID=UPI0021DB7EB2|nr:molybdopterin cofactor-binding domain-containing protein [Pseudomonas tohonis]UXY53865.1 molybdopterin-dependent oxidoreductase [Pseudomonas tohonis]
MSLARPLARRTFLKHSATLASGLAIGFHLGGAQAGRELGTAAGATAPFEPNAWVRVLADGTVRIVVHKHDSGTGTHTALAACVAEELDLDPLAVEVITPENPFFEAYRHPLWKVFSTGGSTSVALEYGRLREAGATARTLLVEAAALRWGVAPGDCSTGGGQVLHGASGRRAGYGELADAAAQLPAPRAVTLKDPEQFRYIGKLRHKRHAADKVSGRFEYGIDARVPGMWVAVVQRSPVVNGRVARIDDAAALKVPGVHRVIRIPAQDKVLGGNQEGVAVLADDYWAARLGRAALVVEWQGGLAEFDSTQLAEVQAKALEDATAKPVPTLQAGDAAAALGGAGRVVRADYRMPGKMQNPLEPVCIIAWLDAGGITFKGGVQVPSFAMEAAEVVCGLPAEKVHIDEMVSGGSFGAREAKYWLFEVAYLAAQAKVPVKLMNSREDEMRALYGHPATFHRLEGALDGEGGLQALRLRAVSPASPEMWEPGYFERPDHMDYSTTEAISAFDFAYRAPHLDLAWLRHESGVPSGWYRSVSFIPNVFAVESFMDELAQAAGRDPLDFRLAHMHERPRHVEVLRSAAKRAGWGSAPGPDSALGIATNQGYGSFIAVIAQVARRDGTVRVERLTCVVDCGLAVSPGGVEEQLQGGLMWGLGHALFDRLDIRQGQVLQSNFHDYRVARMSDMPALDIQVLEGARDKPGGVGELASPAVAPAIANAVFRLTGKRLRDTPLALDGLG